MKKLLSKDLKKYRDLQWKKQKGICPICEIYIEKEDIVLDHDHGDGNCRQVLHRSCNSFEGKIKKDYTRYVSGKGISFVNALQNTVKYLLKDYSKNPIHPTELTELEKELKQVNKRIKSLQRESVIIQYKERAKELRSLIKEERKKNSWQHKK
ncbi:MAG: hypothetical protein HKO92_02190 [Flavobacteriaceae bacterium]|nr:hypothetical protein [Flavobacteriaceae bacterium]